MRIALVVGGANGLGRATAQRFAADGMRVAIADLAEGAAREAAASLQPGEAGHLGIRMDVGEEESVVAGFRSIEDKIGPISVLANFAGIVGNTMEGTPLEMILDASVANFKRVMRTNGLGMLLCIREMARARARIPVEHGRIITIASAAAQHGGNKSSIEYTASKGAVISMTKTAARALAPLKITVNAISPGWIETAMLRESTGVQAPGQAFATDRIPAGRVGRPAEIAAAASYLASVEAGFVTGSTIDVNGGVNMR